VFSWLCSLPASMFACVCAGVPPTGFHRSAAGFRGCAGRGAWMRPCGLSGPDNRSGLVGDLHAGGARSTAEGAARSVVAHPDRVSPTYLTFAPVLARIDRASHLSHTVTSRFHRSVIVCSNGGLFYRAQDGGGHVAFQHATLRCFGGVCRSAHAKDRAWRMQNCQGIVCGRVRRRRATRI